MNDIIPANTYTPIPVGKTIMDALSRLDSKTLLALGGMACLTTVICIGIVCFSGSELTVSKDRLSITQPVPA